MKIRARDISMHYIEAGAGPPLLLIMGLGGDHTAWGFQTPVFAEHYRVIAFDNRGAGQTDQPDVPYTTRRRTPRASWPRSASKPRTSAAPPSAA